MPENWSLLLFLMILLNVSLQISKPKLPSRIPRNLKREREILLFALCRMCRESKYKNATCLVNENMQTHDGRRTANPAYTNLTCHYSPPHPPSLSLQSWRFLSLSPSHSWIEYPHEISLSQFLSLPPSHSRIKDQHEISLYCSLLLQAAKIFTTPPSLSLSLQS